MSTDAKPLFRPEAVRPKVRAFTLPAQADQSKIAKWAKMLTAKTKSKLKETEVRDEFLFDIFRDALGYVTISENPTDYTFKKEQFVEVDGTYADAGFGRFGTKPETPFVVLEGKGPNDPLDRPFAGRKRSAFEQALMYALNLRIDWYLVTNLKETRLYCKQADQFTFERFETQKLATDEFEWKRFVYLLGAERVIGPTGNHLAALLSESAKIGRELTNDFYREYRQLRELTFKALRQENPTRDPSALLTATQKILDRILFIAFCEDRGLLPREIITRAYQHTDPFNPRPVWENFLGLFKSVDKGNDALKIWQYNGGLFAKDEFLDSLIVPDTICEGFKKLADYEYGNAADTEAKLIDVEILGHVFEQSITDLEEIQNVIAGKIPELRPKEQKKNSRKEAGAFYTPAFITRYIVRETLIPVLNARFESLRVELQASMKPYARKALVTPRLFDVETLEPSRKAALVTFWERWLDELATIRIVDPACGSGAFLLEAFDQLFEQYTQAQSFLTALRGSTLFDIRKAILESNLYGVDLNGEAVEIARLSCWIKTAEYGKILTSLDHNIIIGNSVVTDPAVHPKALDWRTAFPKVFAAGGFDVVIGNPPYVRQEWIKDYKPHFEQRFPAVYSGTADLFVYFYVIGHEILKQGGRLGFISSNSYTRATYAEGLRRFLTTECRLHNFIDLSDTITFTDAKDVYPAILIFSKQLNDPGTSVVRTLQFRKEDRGEDIDELLQISGIDVDSAMLDPSGWQMGAVNVASLVIKLQSTCRSLKDYSNGAMYYGVKTGLTEVFVVSQAKRDELIDADAKSAELLRPFVQGTNLREWYIDKSGEYLLTLKSSENKHWSWSTEGENAEKVFAATYPAIHSYLEQHRAACIKRSDQGRFWWELRSCAYWDAFEKPKILWPDIAKRPRFSMDTENRYLGNTAYFTPVSDYYLLGVLNSKAIWFMITNISIRFGERAGEYRYRLFTQYVENLPIPDASQEERNAIGKLAERCNKLGTQRYLIEEQVRHRLLTSFRTDPQTKLNEKAQEWWMHDFIALGENLKKSFKRKQNPFTSPKTADEWEPYIREKLKEVDALRRQLTDAEAEINDRVYKLFHLTADEIKLLQDEVKH